MVFCPLVQTDFRSGEQ